MPKLYSSIFIIKILLSNGFVFVSQKGSHVKYRKKGNPVLTVIVPANKTGTDWLGAVTKVAPMQSHNISVSGGSETGNYLLGFNYFNQDGVVDFTGY